MCSRDSSVFDGESCSPLSSNLFLFLVCSPILKPILKPICSLCLVPLLDSFHPTPRLLLSTNVLDDLNKFLSFLRTSVLLQKHRSGGLTTSPILHQESSFSRPMLDSTSPRQDKSVPPWNTPPQDTEAVHRPQRITTTENPKSMFWFSSILGTLQEGFCPPGWSTSKLPLMDKGGHFCVHPVPGGGLATVLSH